MRFQRRQLLRILSFAFGSNFVMSRNQLGIAAQTAIQPMISPPPAGAALRHGFAGGTEIEKVTGNRRTVLQSSRSDSVGALVPATPGSLAHTIELRGFRLPARGWTHRFSLLSLRPATIFGDAHKVWMVNFRVRDLDRMAAQLRAAGIAVKIDPQSFPNGRFARPA